MYICKYIYTLIYLIILYLFRFNYLFMYRHMHLYVYIYKCIYVFICNGIPFQHIQVGQKGNMATLEPMPLHQELLVTSKCLIWYIKKSFGFRAWSFASFVSRIILQSHFFSFQDNSIVHDWVRKTCLECQKCRPCCKNREPRCSR